jgi:hypothetical protein
MDSDGGRKGSNELAGEKGAEMWTPEAQREAEYDHWNNGQKIQPSDAPISRLSLPLW